MGGGTKANTVGRGLDSACYVALRTDIDAQVCGRGMVRWSGSAARSGPA